MTPGELMRGRTLAGLREGAEHAGPPLSPAHEEEREPREKEREEGGAKRAEASSRFGLGAGWARAGHQLPCWHHGLRSEHSGADLKSSTGAWGWAPGGRRPSPPQGRGAHSPGTGHPGLRPRHADHGLVPHTGSRRAVRSVPQEGAWGLESLCRKQAQHSNLERERIPPGKGAPLNQVW